MSRNPLTLADVFADVANAAPVGQARLRTAVARGLGEGFDAEMAEAHAAAEVAQLAVEASTPLDRRVARCEREGWPHGGRAPIIEDVPVWQRAQGGPFCVVRVADLVTVGLGVPVVREDLAFFAWDEEPIALRVRHGHDTYLFEARDGEARAWKVVPDVAEAPPVLAWLADGAPAWLKVEVQSRLAAHDPAANAMAVGLALRFGQPVAMLTAAQVLERVRRGVVPALVTAARAWGLGRSDDDWAALVDQAVFTADALREQLDEFDPGGEHAADEALRLCRERDDLESLAACLRVAGRASPIEPTLRALDAQAEDHLPALAQAITESDALLDAAAESYPPPWWARAARSGLGA